MKKNYFYFVMLLAGIALLAAIKPVEPLPYGLALGTPDIKSISALSFGKDGILFIGDSKAASVFAIDTKDAKINAAAAMVNISDIDQKIAAALGTQKENITITDMAVNPLSKKLYIAVQSSDGSPALLKVEGDKLAAVSLKDVAFSSVALNDAYAEDAKDGRGRPLRVSTISDLGFNEGKVLVSGLSNKEFSSTLRSIPFPFTDKQEQASLEMYHASHGRFETTSPIRTFTTGKINGKDYLIASYTCTPLVLYPLDELKPGTHVKGRTVAEMGAGNTPIDMTTITKNGETVLIMGNTARGVSEVTYKTIAAFEGTLTEKVAGTAGTTFNVIPTLTKVMQMDKLDKDHVVIIRKNETGAVDLTTQANNAL
ncbi:hypothetical protein GWC95_06930 [Sediminibacterium roseum]|uniref:DNA-binding beta-propeller fold protein YncE n=1 Tax=Sediminibacterium roseum TaxID=1978412 RepID=A0ABW9ZUC7_9BACT|nr:hypothetical protein [Sediminibacterium roseum]NCI49648.1 hypothetical protein [Sediminibacterium roseum]